MKPKFFILTLFWTIAAQALCQHDTIGSDYRFYYPPISDAINRFPWNIPGVCHINGHGAFIPADIFQDQTFEIVSSSPVYIGFVADREMEIIGMSGYMNLEFDTYGNRHFFTGGAGSFLPHLYELAIPCGDSIVTVRDSIILPSDWATGCNRILKGWLNGGLPEEHCALYGDMLEILFNTPYQLHEGDTIFLGQEEVISMIDSTEKMPLRQYIPSMWETHGDFSSPATSDFHFREYLYMANFNGEWVHGTFHIMPFLWAIVRFPDDTCPAPQELRATAIGEGTEFLQFDTMGNHAAWEISYGPSGTAPDDGTVVQTTIPQAVIGNLDPTTRYVAYCRARCDFARSEWSPWSDSLVFTPSLTGIDDAARPQLSLAPNPAHGKVRIACSHAMQAVTLIAADGSTALTLHPDAAEATIDLHALPAGTYTVVAATAAGIATKKLTTW